jgi:5'(3')-deoxyribonucleotidase
MEKPLSLEDMEMTLPISIAVDLDSTLNNLDEVWILKDYNEKYNDHLTKEDMVSWDTSKYVKPECGKKVYGILSQPGYFGPKNLGLKDQWTYANFKWLYQNFDVYIVSSCNPKTVVDKAAWIKHYFPDFDTWNRFVACRPKHLINTDFLIDDGPHNVESFKQRSILIDAPYNRDLIEEIHNFKRLENWKQIREYFEMVKIQYQETMDRIYGTH